MKSFGQRRFKREGLIAAACAVMATLVLAPANAAPASRHSAQPRPDVVSDFRALAQQRPWECEPSASAAWPDGQAACAWQNRLRKHSWSWSDSAGASCISKQALWWNWAQATLPPSTPRSVWDRRWNTQTLHMTIGDEQRLLILRRDGKDRWEATEWRWHPNPRPATRRWQEGRWKLLLEAASQPQYRSEVVNPPDAARIRPVFRALLGTRPGELGPEGLAFEPAGVCLQASTPLPGQPQLSLSYSPNDSRLEQRAAIHLQLSRQHPDAKWLTQFKMLDMPANVPSGAKYVATWIEGGQLIGQLWMPAKGDASTVRIQIRTALPRGQADAAAAAMKVKPIVEHELAAIALQWAAAYE